jgi:signal transduction histidine kinase
MATAVESIAPLATAAGLTLDLQLPATPVRVNGDSARLVQVFANVRNNAVKFTPRELPGRSATPESRGGQRVTARGQAFGIRAITQLQRRPVKR